MRKEISIEAGFGLKNKMSKGIIYYTDCLLEEPIYSTVQGFLLKSELPITSASLKPINFGDNEVIEGERGYPTMVKQIISCLERSMADYVFFCEHDVLYPVSHFDFDPYENNIFYYNRNVWRWRYGSNKAVKYHRMIPLSCLCVNREFALAHYKDRLKRILELNLDSIKGKEPEWVRKMGYEPGTKKKRRGGFSDDDFDTWKSKSSIVDIRHGGTFSSPKDTLEQFKHKPQWWIEKPVEQINGWNLKELFNL